MKLVGGTSLNTLARFLIAVALLLLTALPVCAAGKGIVLNFSDVDISTMVKFISDLTGRNFVLDERVKGKISVYSPSKLSADEAFAVFTSVLDLKGFSVVQTGRVYKIVPSAVAKQSGMKLLTGSERTPVNEAYVARVIALDRIPSQEAATFLQPVVSKDGYVASFGPANMLLVVDSAVNIQKVLDIIKTIDTDMRRDGAELVFLKHASADNVALIVREWLFGRDRSKSGAQTAQSQTQGQLITVGGLLVPDARLNAVIIFGSDADKEEIKKFIAMIDVMPPTSSSKINVYYLENADATDVGKVLETMIKGTSASTGTSQAITGQQQVSFEGSRISISPDKATNSLVIMASPADYQNLIQVIRKLDRRRRQVFVKALVAEVSLDKVRDIGLQLGVGGAGSDGTIAAAGVLDPFNFLGASNAQQQAVVKILSGLSNNVNFSGVLKLLDQNGAVNVLSTPNILTSDNKEAEIFVGENIPLLTSTTLSSTGLSQQSIERKDTGITLKITPQITEGEYIKLDIYQEISAVKNSKGEASDLVTTKRSAKTSVVVKDSDSVVIGGLIQTRDEENIEKIPLLGDIPLLGYLFKTKSTQRTKTNLIIILTPRIIRSGADMAAISGEQRDSFEDAVDRQVDLTRELRPGRTPDDRKTEPGAEPKGTP
ncbi:MAG: type II secretion system secretin GspD [Geobacteraceae bacterium]|nr:type II secretion system secretin GspD [Geobacteraceae bacterium]